MTTINEPQHLIQPNTPKTEPRRAIGTLNEALRFTLADLAANRAGHLSDSQIEALRRAWRRSAVTTAVIVIGIGIGAILMLYAGQQNGSFVLTLIGIALTLLNAGIVGFAAQARIRLNADLRQPIIAVRGIVRHTIRVSGKAATYILDVEGTDSPPERMLVAKPVFFAFEENVPYCLYRTAASKTLLSAEPQT